MDYAPALLGAALAKAPDYAPAVIQGVDNVVPGAAIPIIAAGALLGAGAVVAVKWWKHLTGKDVSSGQAAAIKAATDHKGKPLTEPEAKAVLKLSQGVPPVPGAAKLASALNNAAKLSPTLRAKVVRLAKDVKRKRAPAKRAAAPRKRAAPKRAAAKRSRVAVRRAAPRSAPKRAAPKRKRAAPKRKVVKRARR